MTLRDLSVKQRVPEAIPGTSAEGGKKHDQEAKKMLCRIIVTAVLVLAIRLFSIGGLPGTLLYLAAYLIIGYDILRKAVKGILRGQVFDETS